MELNCKSLVGSDLFKTKNHHEIHQMLSTISYCIKYFEKDELIFRVDQPTQYMGILIQGNVEVQKNLASGKIINILYKEKGALFGEGSVFSDAATYPCNIASKSKSTILLITKKNMLQLLSKDDDLLNNFLNSIANRVLLLNLKTELLSYSSIQKKIAFSLLYLMDSATQGNVVCLPYSKKNWSEHLNVSRPSLFRELKDLCTRQIIAVNRSEVTILDEKKLSSILEE